ncbi:MAG: redox-sensing transcriptional repressor Rex [Actinomycetota bacterium]|jgi:redox-sensing transcriptional repressor
MSDTPRRRIPEAALGRLPIYLRILVDLANEGTNQISSEQLAELAAVNAAKVRKDLSYLGTYGTRGVGYEVQFLTYQIQRELGLNQSWPVIVVGAGNLGQALANFTGISERGFHIVGVVDKDESKIGQLVGGVRVRHADELQQIASQKAVSIGIIATPAQHAQEAADSLVRAGIGSIMNFAPTVISVPRGVNVRKVDLALELQILSYYEQTRNNGLRAVETGDASGSVSA